VGAADASAYAGSHGAKRDRPHTHSGGNGWPWDRRHERITHHPRCLGVQQASPAGRNPDALLFVGGHGNGAGVRHCSAALVGSIDTAHRLAGGNPDAPVARNRWRSRHAPGRNGDTRSPGNDSGHSDTAAHSDPSASFADEDWRNRAFSVTLTLLCECTVGGVASVPTVKSELALRPALRPLPLIANPLDCQPRPQQDQLAGPGVCSEPPHTLRFRCAANSRAIWLALTRCKGNG
jgi:hypothetical protein